MAGSKRERPPGSGRWELRAYAGRDPVTDTKRYKSKTFHGGARDAERALAKLVTECAAERAPDTEGTLAYLLTTWMRAVERDRSPATVGEYWRIIDTLWIPRLGEVKLAKLSQRQLQAVLDAEFDRGLSASSVERQFAVVRRALKEAVRMGWIQHSPGDHIVLPAKRQVDKDPPTIPELLAILAAADARDPALGMLLRVSAAMGVRRGELCGLRWRDVNLDTRRVTVRSSVVVKKNRKRPGESPRRREVVVKDTKTHQKRPLTIDAGTTELLKALRLYVEDVAARESPHGLVRDAFVFSREPDGRAPLRPPWITEAFKKAARDAGLEDVNLHQLRHLNASLQLAAGVPLAVVSKRLGHRLQSTTLNIYSHVLDGDEAAADVLGALLAPPPTGELPKGAMNSPCRR